MTLTKYIDPVNGSDSNTGNDTANPYQHILYAIARGATIINCAPGTYNEDIHLRDCPHRYPIEIAAQSQTPKPTIQGSQNNFGTIQIDQLNPLTITGFIVAGHGGNTIGVKATQSASVYLKDCQITNVGTCAWADQSGTLTLKASVPIEHDCISTAAICGDPSTGANLNLRGNHTFAGMKYGIRVLGSGYFMAETLTLNQSQVNASHTGALYVSFKALAVIRDKLTVNKAPGPGVFAGMNSFITLKDIELNDCYGTFTLEDCSQIVQLGTYTSTGTTPNTYIATDGCVLNVTVPLTATQYSLPNTQYTYDNRYQTK